MRLWSRLRSWSRANMGRSRMESEMDAELKFHMDAYANDLVRSGVPREEAMRRARLEFGGIERAKEECRDATGVTFVESIAQDIRYGLRMLRKSPSFAVAAVATLALAIGANTVAFAALNALILRPVNLPDPQSLYVVEHPDGWGYQSYPNYLDIRDRNRSFAGLATDNISQAALDTGQNPSREFLFEASGNYFDVLGIHPYLGRLFHASDEAGPNSAPYIVLTYNFWQSRFQGDPHVIGRTVLLDKHPFTIIGVTQPGFQGTLSFFPGTFYVPIVNEQQIEGGDSLLNVRGSHWISEEIGHLKSGVTLAQAIADLNSIGSWLKNTYPKEVGETTFRLGQGALGGDLIGGPTKAFLAALMLLAGMILLAACANLGSLFAARAADRSRELALRLALGASRIRILRQLFTEAILISLIGGAVGLSGSVMLLQQLGTWRPFPQFPFNISLHPDVNVYVVALLLSLTSGFLFGAIPVRQVLHADPYEIVKSGSLARVGRRITARDILLGAQIAICAVLVTSSFVAVRGLMRSLHSNFGFDPQSVMLVDTDLNMAGYKPDAQPIMQKRMIEAMQAIPGVQSVGLVGQYPPLHMGWNEQNVFTDQTANLKPSNAAASVIWYGVSPKYFPSAGTTLLSGRAFTWQDDKTAPRLAVVNQYFARKVFGSVPNALGRYFKLRDGERIQVVGVAENGKYTANLTEEQKAAAFFPILQTPFSETWLVVRSSRDPQQLAREIRNQLRGLDSGLPAYIDTWSQDMNGALFASRMAAMSLGVLGVIGALLSITGIFGMAAYAVSRRKRDLGIRIALGAQRREVLQAALGRAVKLLAFGSGAGLLLGILASRVLASIVYQATPRDPLVLAGVVLAMALVGLVATWIPAQRALSIDPVMLLREE